MTPPLYQGHQMPDQPGDGHRGLWFDRFFDRYAQNWTILKGNPQQTVDEGKKNWINTVTGSPCGDADLLKSACRRQETLGIMLGGRIAEMKTTWLFATGLGNPHPVENGFAWHPTLGVPYLTGAAVKGLVRAWVEGGWMEVSGETETEQHNNRLATLYRWFGSEDMDPKERTRLRQEGFTPPSRGDAADTQAGQFIFFDAIPIAPVTLACDVMTPHYGKWYEEGGTIENVAAEPQKVPADWHSPVPVPFLTVKAATFLFCVAPRRLPRNDAEKDEVAKELGEVMRALTDALQYLGAGAKTAAGYGRMEVDKAAEGKREKAAEQARMNTLSPEERMRVEVTNLTPDQIAKMFGKNFNIIKEKKGEDWVIFLELVRSVHSATILSWAEATEKNRRKAFKRLSTPEEGQE